MVTSGVDCCRGRKEEGDFSWMCQKLAPNDQMTTDEDSGGRLWQIV